MITLAECGEYESELSMVWGERFRVNGNFCYASNAGSRFQLLILLVILVRTDLDQTKNLHGASSRDV